MLVDISLDTDNFPLEASNIPLEIKFPWVRKALWELRGILVLPRPFISTASRDGICVSSWRAKGLISSFLSDFCGPGSVQDSEIHHRQGGVCCLQTASRCQWIEWTLNSSVNSHPTLRQWGSRSSVREQDGRVLITPHPTIVLMPGQHQTYRCTEVHATPWTASLFSVFQWPWSLEFMRLLKSYNLAG